MLLILEVEVLPVLGQFQEVAEPAEVAFMVAGAAVGAADPSMALNLHLQFALVDHDFTENCSLVDLQYRAGAMIVP